MNMLVIGNGFDLAHGRPTKYGDFLEFAKHIMLVKGYKGNKEHFQEKHQENLSKMNSEVRDYILETFDDRVVSSSETTSKNENIKEIYELLQKNVWFEYFKQVHNDNKLHGENWVDFEMEIREVIDFFDHHIKGLYDYLPTYDTSFKDESEKADMFWRKFNSLNPDLKNHKGKPPTSTLFNFIEKTYKDLKNLIRCLEIYLYDCVKRLQINDPIPDIIPLKIGFILSFNYTEILSALYPSFPSFENIHYVHGNADAQRPRSKNNMVLGVNEYWDGPEKNVRTNFNCYKKFVQRIIKKTEIKYKEVLEKIEREREYCKPLVASWKNLVQSKRNNVYIFGHSLDVSDKDILKEIIETKGVVTTIFYRNEQQQADQIANLSKILGQDELLKCVSSTSPTIIFQQQTAVEKCPSKE